MTDDERPLKRHKASHEGVAMQAPLSTLLAPPFSSPMVIPVYAPSYAITPPIPVVPHTPAVTSFPVLTTPVSNVLRPVTTPIPAPVNPAKPEEAKKKEEGKPAEPNAVVGTATTTKSTYGPCALIGYRISVYWGDYDKWYPGTIQAYNPEMKQHEVLYDDDPDDTILEKLLGDNIVGWRFIGPRDLWEGALAAAKRDKPLEPSSVAQVSSAETLPPVAPASTLPQQSVQQTNGNSTSV